MIIANYVYKFFNLAARIFDEYGNPVFDFRRTELQFLDGNAVYIAVPSNIVWNSFSDAGTSGTDFYGDAMTSAGSFWWGVMNM